MSAVTVGHHAVVHVPRRGLDGMVSEGGEWRELAAWCEIWWEAGHHAGHVLEIEASRGSRGRVIVHWEVTIAVSVGARGSYVGWIKDVVVHKCELQHISRLTKPVQDLGILTPFLISLNHSA